MVYDFISTLDRSKMSSAKWDGMKQTYPDVPEGIIPFSVADMELKNPPEILEGLKECLDNLILGYTNPSKEYFDAVCSWMRAKHNWPIKEEWICVAPGVVPAIFNAVKAYSKIGEGIIIMTPVYHPFYEAIKQNGRKIIKNPLINRGNHYEIDFEDLEKKASDSQNTMLILCSPHNPVGRVWSKAELIKIADICISNNVLVVSDEIHFDLVMPGFHHIVFSTLSDEIAEKCIVCTAPSKTFNLAGMQTSNIIIKSPELRSKFMAEMEKSSQTLLNTLGYKACEIAYHSCSTWLSQLITLIDINRKLVEDFMPLNIPKIKVYPMEGTYLQWWDCRELGMNNERLKDFMATEALLFLSEGYFFGEEGNGFERVNLACPTKLLIDGLNRLNEAVKRLPRSCH